jgi:hypothetical protein
VSNFVSGEWNAICDICGFEFKSSKLQENWKGQRVCDKDFETRHPQEFVRPRVKEPHVPSWVRLEEDADVPFFWYTPTPIYTPFQWTYGTLGTVFDWTT